MDENITMKPIKVKKITAPGKWIISATQKRFQTLQEEFLEWAENKLLREQKNAEDRLMAQLEERSHG